MISKLNKISRQYSSFLYCFHSVCLFFVLFLITWLRFSSAFSFNLIFSTSLSLFPLQIEETICPWMHTVEWWGPGVGDGGGLERVDEERRGTCVILSTIKYQKRTTHPLTYSFPYFVSHWLNPWGFFLLKKHLPVSISQKLILRQRKIFCCTELTSCVHISLKNKTNYDLS